MSRNQALLEVLNSEQFLMHQDAKLILLQLLRAGNNLNFFLDQEKAFFSQLSPNIFSDNDEHNSFIAEGEGTPEQQAVNSIEALRQKMFELLLVSSLPQASIELLDKIVKTDPLPGDIPNDQEAQNIFRNLFEILKQDKKLFTEEVKNKAMRAAREILSQHYYVDGIKNNEDQDEIRFAQLAACNSLDDMKRLFPEDTPEARQHREAFAEKSVPVVRETAAMQLLMLKVVTCNNPAALQELVNANSLDALKVVLGKYEELGFKGTTPRDASEAFVSPEKLPLLNRFADIFEKIPGMVRSNPNQIKSVIKGEHFEDLKKQIPVSLFNSIRAAALYEYFKVRASGNQILNEDLERIVQGDLSHLSADLGLDLLDDQALLLSEKIKENIQGIAAATLVLRKAALPGKAFNTLVEDVNKPFRNELHNYQEKIVKLPGNDIHEFNLERIKILLSKAPPEQLENLDVMKNAGNFDEFRVAAERMGLEGVGNLMRPGDLEPIQAVISTANYIEKLTDEKIKNSIDKVSPFAEDSHPELFKLLRNLSPEKRHEVLNDETKLINLMYAKHSHQVELLVGSVSNRLLEPLLEENKKHEHYSRIHNAEIARYLASVGIAHSLTDPQIQGLNQRIREIDSPAHLREFIIGLTAYGYSLKNLERVFNIEDGALPAPELFEAINDQTRYNQSIRNAPIGAFNTFPEIGGTRYITLGENNSTIDEILGAEKTGELSQTELKLLLQDVIFIYPNAKTLLESQPQYLQKFKDGGIHFFTDDLFSTIRKAQIKGGLTDSPISLKNTLESIKARIDSEYAVFSNLSKADSKIRKKSEELITQAETEQFDPIYAELLVGQGKNNLADLNTWAAHCEKIIRNDLKLQASIQDAIAELMNTTNQTKAVKALQADLEKKLEKVQDNLELYQNTYHLLKGDPNSNDPKRQKGLIPFYEEQQTLLSGQQKNRQLRYLAKDDFKDYPLADKKARMERVLGTNRKAPDPASVPDFNLGQDVESKASSYQLANPIPQGSFREHAVYAADGNEMGAVIEERGAQDLTTLSGQKATQLSVRVSANGFPVDPMKDAISLKKAIHISMKEAEIILNNLPDDYPGKNSPPIRINGNAKQVEIMWTALMILIEDRKLKIPESHIKINPNCSFDPKSQYTFGKTVLGFDGSSAYKTVFKANPDIVDAYRKPMKNLEEEKVNASKFFKELLSASKESKSIETKVDRIIGGPGSPGAA